MVDPEEASPFSVVTGATLLSLSTCSLELETDAPRGSTASSVGTVWPLTTTSLWSFEVVVGVSFAADISWSSYPAEILSRSASGPNGGLTILPEESCITVYPVGISGTLSVEESDELLRLSAKLASATSDSMPPDVNNDSGWSVGCTTSLSARLG